MPGTKQRRNAAEVEKVRSTASTAEDESDGKNGHRHQELICSAAQLVGFSSSAGAWMSFLCIGKFLAQLALQRIAAIAGQKLVGEAD